MVYPLQLLSKRRDKDDPMMSVELTSASDSASVGNDPGKLPPTPPIGFRA
jgi:hypothetical protein